MTNSPQESPSSPSQNPDKQFLEMPKRLEALHVPKGAAAGFSEPYLGSYAVGLEAFDTVVYDQLVRGSFDTYNTLYTATDKLYAIASPRAKKAKDIRDLEETQGSSPIPALDFSSPEFTILANSLTDKASKGLEDASIQPFLHAAEQITYYEQNPTEAHKGILLIPENTASKLEIPAGAGFSAQTIHERLKERGLLNMSRQALNRRFAAFEKTAQVSILELMAGSFSLIADLDNKRRNQAAYSFIGLLNLGRANDLKSRMEMLKRLSDEWQRESINEERSHVKTMVGLVAVRASLIEIDVQKRIDFFAKIYDELGYRYPMEGMGEQPVRIFVPEQAPSQIEQEKAAAEEARQRALAEIDALMPMTIRQVEQFNAKWSLASKAFKQGGYQNIRYALIGEDRNHKLPQDAIYGKPEARQFIDFLAILERTFSQQDTARVKDFMLVSQITEQSLAQQVHGLNQALHSYRPAAEKMVEPRPVTAMRASLEAHWESYRRLIVSLWPANGEQLASQLEQLWADPEETPAISETPQETMPELAADAPESLAQADLEELDAVVLPPEPRDEQIHTELTRLGVKPRDLTAEKMARFKDFLGLTEVFTDHKLLISKSGPKSPKRYYVLKFTYEGKNFAVAESVSLERATYIIAEHLTPGTTQEILDLYKKDAQAVGARQIKHVNDGRPHNSRIFDAILEMHAAELE